MSIIPAVIAARVSHSSLHPLHSQQHGNRRRLEPTRTETSSTSYPKLFWRRNQALQALPTTDARIPATGRTTVRSGRAAGKKKKKIEACTRLEMKRRFPPTRRTGRTRRSPRSEASTACMYFHGSFNVYFHDCHVPPLVLWWRYSVLGGSFTTFISPPAKLLVRAQCFYLHVNSKSLYARRLFMCRSARNDGCPAQTNPIQDPTLTPTLKS